MKQLTVAAAARIAAAARERDKHYGRMPSRKYDGPLIRLLKKYTQGWAAVIDGKLYVVDISESLGAPVIRTRADVPVIDTKDSAFVAKLVDYIGGGKL